MAIGFQSSRWNDAGSVRFTVNLLSVLRADWDALRTDLPHFPERPSPNTAYGWAAMPRRLGELTDGRDLWWEIHDRDSARRAADGVLSRLSARGLDWLRAPTTSEP